MSSKKETKAPSKRKAEGPADANGDVEIPAKKQDVGQTKLTVFYVKDIPSSDPKHCINQNISSGLVVGFSIQEIANVLFNEFFDDTLHSESEQQKIQEQIESWISGGIEVSLTKPHLYVVSDGPPLSMKQNEKKGSDARLDNHTYNVFISKNFSEQSIFPGVAVGVEETQRDFEERLKLYIEENVSYDHRPEEIKDSVQPSGKIIKINLKDPGFYRLASGAPFTSYCQS